MSRRIPRFLERLELGFDADSKTIRRAYARELKLIDQENDLAGFQLLREAYEAALEWARQAQAPAEPAWQPQDPVTVPPAPETRQAPPAAPQFTPAPPLEDPHALAEAVFARLCVNTKRIVDLGLLKDPILLEAEIRQRLADDELLNISARALFEARVAQLLFSEWTMEAGPLFGAAAAVFGWEQDRRRLQRFGHVGAFLDRAIDERTLFQGQNTEELTKQRHVMARLRQPQRPTIVQIRRDMAYVERMITRFPNLLAIMVSREAVEEWRTLAHKASPAQAPGAADTMPEPVLAGHANKRRFDGAWLFFALLVAFYVGMSMFGNNRPSYSYPEPSAPDSAALSAETSSSYPSYAPGADPSAPDYQPRQVQPHLKPPAPEAAGAMLYEQVYDAIAKDIQYKPAAGAQKGTRTVVFEVLAGPNGKIYGMNRMRRSIDPDFDEAVQAAIMRAKPLPISFGTRVQMQFNLEWFKRPVRRKAAAARESTVY